MSNCIRLRNPEVYFSVDEIDVGRLAAITDRVGELPEAPDWEQDPEGYMTWWFLMDNSEVEVDDSPGGCRWFDGITIRFGEGRSEHTNRDFKALCLMLNKYMLKDKEVRFWVYDECDGFEECCYWDVKFEVVDKGIEEQERFMFPLFLSFIASGA